jgi:hypothetical protein
MTVVLWRNLMESGGRFPVNDRKLSGADASRIIRLEFPHRSVLIAGYGELIHPRTVERSRPAFVIDDEPDRLGRKIERDLLRIAASG